MKHITLLVLSILSIQFAQSQINEIGLYLGGSNFIGDVGSTNYISPNQLAIGGIYKWNRSRRHSYRASLIFSKLEANDIDSEDPRRVIRGYEFSTNIIEASIGMELTFKDFNLHSERKIGTPYLHSGITYTRHENLYFPAGVQTSENNKSWALGIPMTLGYKASFIDNIVLGIEIGARYTFTDELDGSIPNDPTLQIYRFGNINNNDWYVFSGITLTYTFGENPCYCVE